MSRKSARILEPPSDPAACPHRPPCPGCPRFGETRLALAVRGALEELERIHRLPGVALISGATAGFRHRARLAIRGRVGSPKLGLFELGTHRVVHIPNCRVQHPLINRVASVLRRALVETGLSSYSDQAQLGLARYLQVAVERASQSAQVVVVGNSATAEPFRECFELLRERLGPELHSLWYNVNQDATNTILGPDFHPVCGPPTLVERFGGAAVHYPPGAFGQNHLDLAERLIGEIRARIPAGARVAEFYAGVGAIGLSIAGHAGPMTLNELSPASLLGLECGLAQLDPSIRAAIQVIPGPAGAARQAADGADVVIVDPPRKGLDPELTLYLAERPPQRLLYVSCGLDSFARDSAQLTSGGRLKLTELTAFNLFPFTDHVEILGQFVRV